MELHGAERPWQHEGISAHVANHALYVTAHRGAAAFDLLTDKMLWHTDSLGTGLYDDGDCCDNGHITVDGKSVIAGSRWKKNRWGALDAATGKIIKEIPAPDSKNPHNMVISVDGTRAYLAPSASRLFTVIDTKTFEKVGLVGPTTEDVRTFTINGAGTRLYTTMVGLLGFEILDTKTGQDDRAGRSAWLRLGGEKIRPWHAESRCGGHVRREGSLGE